MNILVSNDDGVHAEGIRLLTEELKQLGDVTIVAPDRNRSGASNSLTLDAPLRINEIEPKVFSVEGTPTDCVHFGITGLLDQMPDIVVSGINEVGNLGDDVLYSGTVAAAIEGRYLGLPAVAVSLCGSNGNKHYDTAAWVACQLVQRLQQDPLPASTILNINVPNVSRVELRGFEVTRFGARHLSENIIPMTDPRGRKVYWIGPAGQEQDAGPGTDFHAVANKKVSISPMKIDMTHYETFEQLSHWVEGLTNEDFFAAIRTGDALG